MKKVERNKMNKYLLPVGVVMLALGLAGCGAKEEVKVTVNQVTVDDSNPAAAEQVSRVTYADVIQQDLYEGTITPYVEELFFEEKGSFKEYCVSIGEEVKKGQVLARLDTEKIQENIDSLQEKVDSIVDQYEYKLATLKNSEAILLEEREINYEILEGLQYMTKEYTATCQAIGRQTKDIEEKQLEMKHLTEVYELELPYYQEKLKEAKAELGGNEIRAPFDGTITQLRYMSGGTAIDDETACVAIADTTRHLIVSTYLSSNVISRAERVYAFINGKEYEVEYIPLSADTYSEMIAKNIEVYSTYEIVTDEEMQFGQYAMIVVVNSSKRDVLVVPYLALKRENSGYYCYVKRGDTKEKVYLEIGENDTMNYEVKSGLVEGDEVYIE